MGLIVLDLEWNQSSTGREPEVAKLPFEIIEIGAIKLNEEYEMVSEFSELIKPIVYPRLYHITSKIIHIQMDELSRGGKFTTISDKFKEWCGEDALMCTWGPSDITELQRNLKFFGKELLNDGPVRYIDVQKLYALSFDKDPHNRISLERAVDALGIEKDIPFHRAFGDAYYTAKIMTKIAKEHPEVLKFVSFDVTFPPKTKEDEVFIDFGTYSKQITHVFKNRESALTDKSVMSIVCTKCGKPIKKRIGWFSPNGKQFMAAGVCDVHGLIKNRIRIHKYDDDTVCVIKIVKPIENDGLIRLQEKSARAEELRRKRKEAEKKAKEFERKK
ncbi:MAG: exonuclease domain-containing protein [Lachnospiraceae bacterium]|nr:exonuclease domain-containing protein [Lachnospiraceae bacterium]